MMTEAFGLMRIDNSISFSFHPAYNSRHFAADYGQRYHCDPMFRIETDIKVAKGLYREFGEYGIGDPDPKPELSVGIQPLDFMNAALGGQMIFKSDESVRTPDRPLSNIKCVSQLEKMGDIDWKNHPLFHELFRQVDQMRSAYPELPVSGVQGVWQDGEDGQHSFLTMHTPYTTAFRLVGDEILVIMMLDADFAVAIFDWLMRQYERLWQAICDRFGWRGTKIHFGDCAATMLSPELYERLSLPLYQRLMANYEGGVIHSCGGSSHLLELFAQVPRINQLQLGDGTDLKKARDLFPHSSIYAYYDPGQFRTDRPEHIEKKLWQMCEQLQDNFSVECGGADPDTPEENVMTFLTVAKKIKKTLSV